MRDKHPDINSKGGDGSMGMKEFRQNENNSQPNDERNAFLYPVAMEESTTDEDDGIFMSWPTKESADNAPFSADETADADADADEDDKDIPHSKNRKAEKTRAKKQKADKHEKHDKGAQYTFQTAAHSDLWESDEKNNGKTPDTDNEATLSSIKYYKHTSKVKQLFLRRILPLVIVLLFSVGFVLYFFRLQHLSFVNLTGYAAEDVFAATGIHKNMFIFSVNASDIRKRLRTRFPYIQNVSVELELPDTVNLVFEEDCAMFYTQMYDEYFVISQSLRVLARYDSLEEMNMDLRAVTLPAVSYAVVGHPLAFFDASYPDFLKTFLATMEESDIYDRITKMDLSNRFDLQLLYDDRIRVYLGDSTYLASNLSFIKSIVEELDDNDRGDLQIIDNKTASFSEAVNGT